MIEREPLGAAARDGGRARGRPRRPRRRRGSPPRPASSSCRALGAAGAPASARRGAARGVPARPARRTTASTRSAARELELLARRSFDARAVLARRSPRGGPTVAAAAGRGAGVAGALDAWAGWYADALSEPPPAPAPWDPQRMEYRFQVAAGLERQGEVQLDAAEYAGGRLDWYSFDVAPRTLPGMGARGALEQPRPARACRRPPASPARPRRAGGRSRTRAVWFGDLDTAPEDLARVAVAASARSFGDDWFLVPCRLPAGVHRRAPTRVTVLDTFGEAHASARAPSSTGPAASGASSSSRATPPPTPTSSPGPRRCPWLFLPPALAGVHREPRRSRRSCSCATRSPTSAGRPSCGSRARPAGSIDRAARARAARRPPPAPPPTDAWRYRLATPVPDHQVPLVPGALADDGGLYLQRGRLAIAVRTRSDARRARPDPRARTGAADPRRRGARDRRARDAQLADGPHRPTAASCSGSAAARTPGRRGARRASLRRADRSDLDVLPVDLLDAGDGALHLLGG